jgi:hypothetical protein
VKRPTRTKRSILVRPKNELRRLNRSEKVKRGLSLKGAYYVPKGTKVTKSTAYVTVSSWRDFQLGVPHGKAAKMRKAKELGYGPRGLSEFAPQSVRTRIRLGPSRNMNNHGSMPTSTPQVMSPMTSSGSRGCATCRTISTPLMSQLRLTMELVCSGSNTSKS